MADEYDDDFETIDEEETVKSPKPIIKSTPDTVRTSSSSVTASSSTTTVVNPSTSNNKNTINKSSITNNDNITSPISPPPNTSSRTKVSSSSSRTPSSSSSVSTAVIEQKKVLVTKGIRDGLLIHTSIQTNIDNHHQSVQCNAVEQIHMGLQIPDDLGIPNIKIGTVSTTIPSTTNLPSITSTSPMNTVGTTNTPSTAQGSTKISKDRISKTTSSSSTTTSSTSTANTTNIPIPELTNERLQKFLYSSTKVMEMILEDNLYAYQYEKHLQNISSNNSKHNNNNTIKSFIPLLNDIIIPKLPLFAGRTITAITQSYHNTYEIAIAFSTMNTEITLPVLVRSGISILPQYRDACIVCILSTIDNSIVKILVCWPSTIITTLSYCNVPDSNILLAGSSSGTIYAWNINEPVWLHNTLYGTGISNTSSTSARPSTILPINLTIESGLRAPSFSAYAFDKSGDTSLSNINEGGSITRIISLDKNVSSVSSTSNFSSTTTTNKENFTFRIGMGLKSLVNHTLSTTNDISNNNTSSVTTTTNYNKQNSYQFAIINEYGIIQVWIILRLPIPNLSSSAGLTNSNAGSTSNTTSNNLPSASTLVALIDERDYGRGITGTLRMIKSSLIIPENIFNPSNDNIKQGNTSNTLVATKNTLPLCLDCDTNSDATKFIFALQNGYLRIINYNNTYNDKLLPSIYYPPSIYDDHILNLYPNQHIPPGDGPLLNNKNNVNPILYPSTGIIATVVKFHSHPLLHDIFIVGFSNGSISLYSIKHAYPLTTWTLPNISNSTNKLSNSSAIIYLSWLQYRPSIVVCLNAVGQLTIWDLQKQLIKPIMNYMVNTNPNDDNNNITNILTNLNLPNLMQYERKVTTVTGHGGSLLSPSQVSLYCTIPTALNSNDIYSSNKVQSITLPSSFTIPILQNDGIQDNKELNDNAQTMLKVIEKLLA